MRAKDLDKDDYVPEPYKEEAPKAVNALHKREAKDKKEKERRGRTKLQALGFEGEFGDAAF